MSLRLSKQPPSCFKRIQGANDRVSKDLVEVSDIYCLESSKIIKNVLGFLKRRSSFL